VLPTHRKTVRMNFKLSVEKAFYGRSLAMEVVHQPGRILEQNGIHGNRMISHCRLPE
jgi:hypothetical protein